MILEREDVRLNYFVTGDGPPVTLLHGFTPNSVVTDGPVVTKANAAGMQWMQDHYLI